MDANKLPSRRQRFQLASPSANVLPLIDVDSGYRTSFGGQADYYKLFKRMIDEALRRKPGVDILAAYKVVNADVVLSMRVTNHSGVTLSSGNGATLTGIIWAEQKVIHTGRSGFGEQINGLCGKGILLNGETTTCNLTMKDKAKDLGSRGQVLALVDYRPGGASGAYDLLNAAHAVKGELPPLVEPTAVPPTDTPVPPEPSPTSPPIVIDMPPRVKAPIADISVMEDEPVASIDLSKVFEDADSDPGQMTFEVSKNSNPDLVDPSIKGTMLELAIPAGKTGSTEINIRCTSDGKSVTDSFTLTVKAKGGPVGPTGGKVFLPWLER